MFLWQAFSERRDVSGQNFECTKLMSNLVPLGHWKGQRAAAGWPRLGCGSKGSRQQALWGCRGESPREIPASGHNHWCKQFSVWEFYVLWNNHKPIPLIREKMKTCPSVMSPPNGFLNINHYLEVKLDIIYVNLGTPFLMILGREGRTILGKETLCVIINPVMVCQMHSLL